MKKNGRRKDNILHSSVQLFHHEPSLDCPVLLEERQSSVENHRMRSYPRADDNLPSKVIQWKEKACYGKTKEARYT